MQPLIYIVVFFKKKVLFPLITVFLQGISLFSLDTCICVICYFIVTVNQCIIVYLPYLQRLLMCSCPVLFVFCFIFSPVCILMSYVFLSYAHTIYYILFHLHCFHFILMTPILTLSVLLFRFYTFRSCSLAYYVDFE